MAESFSTGCGGKGANQAVAAARLSKLSSGERLANVEIIGAVGVDDFGRSLKRNLSADGVNVSKVKEIEGVATGTATILVEKETGENRILVAAGANNHVVSKLDDGGRYGGVLLCQLECPLDSVLSHMKAAKLSGSIVLLNPAPATQLSSEFFTNTDYLILNESEAALLSRSELTHPFPDAQLEAITQQLIEKGVQVVVITLGGEGSYYGTAQGASGRVRAEKVKVVDTTAAGDTFVGAFAVRIALSRSESNVTESNIRNAMEFGTVASALTVQKAGAQDSIPRLADIPDSWLRFLQRITK